MNTSTQHNIKKGLCRQWRTLALMLVLLVTPALLVQAHGDGFHIEGMAWVDDNGDGIQDASENGLGTIAVYLFDDNNGLVDTQTTAPDGSYSFHITEAGSYSVQFAANSAYDFSPQFAGTATTDSDVDAGGRSAEVSFSVGDGSVDSSLNSFSPATTEAYLENPSMGWQQTPGRQNFLLPETVAFPNRENISWQILNPGENTYDWSELDNRLNQAVSEGKLFSFRVYSMRGEQWGGHQVPQWVLNKGATITGGAPDYSNCVYQEEWAGFVNKLRQRYDGNPNIAYIDVSGYSDFNEWSWNAQTVWDDDYPNNLSLDGYARQRLADIFIGGGKNQHECRQQNGGTSTVSYNYPGFSQTQLIMPYAGVRQALWYVTDKRADIGIRYDCLGRPGDNNLIMNQIGEQINTTWQDAPIVYELCPGSINYSQTQDLLERSHGSLVHDNENQRNQSQTEDVMRYAGYRYIVSDSSIPAEASINGIFDVEMTWQNIGYAPAYASMGNLFELRVYLVEADGTIVQDVVSDSVPNNWMPATNIQGGSIPNNNITETITVPDVDPGTYTVEVAIVNSRDGAKINLGLQGRTSDGQYPVGTINVVDATGSGGVTDYTLDAGYVPLQQSADINLNLNALSVSVDEGGMATLTGTVENANSVTASIGDISMNGADWGWMFSPADGPDDSQTVSITASNDTDSVSSTFSLTVNNSVPTADFQIVDNTQSAGPLTQADALRVDVIFSNQSDSSSTDTAAGFLYAVDCNSDGTFDSAGTAPNLTCDFNAAGTYTLTGRISDKDAGYTDYSLSVTLNDVPGDDDPGDDDPGDDDPGDDDPGDDTPAARALNSFVMQAIGRVRLMNDSRVLSGHVSSDDRVVVRPGTQVISPDSVIVTDYLNLQASTLITGAEFNRITNNGTISGTEISPATLPVSDTPALPDMTPGTEEIIVNSNQSRTLDAGSYALLYVKSGATVTLTGGVYEFASWDIRKNARVEFAAPVDIRIVDHLKTATGVSIVPQADSTQPHGSVLYIAGSNGGDGGENATPRAAQFGNSNTIQMSVYAPNGMLRIGNDSNAAGAFIGQWIYLGYRSQVMLDSVFGLNLDFSGYTSVGSAGDDDDAPDSDGDGIPDAEDICPNVAGFDNIGDPCNLDEDNDSVPDTQDVCPNDALHDMVGDPCNHDEDSDGVADSIDACPTEAGNNNGCPIADADGDGFSDNSDSCPNEYGTNNGCPDAPDVDNDGFADTEDACPTVYGTDNGCPAVVDNDNDGFPDNNDACPTVYGTDNGCPVSDNNDNTGNNNGGNSGNNGNTGNNNGGNSGNNGNTGNNNGGNSGNNGNTGNNNGGNSDNNNNSGADSDWDGVADNVDQCPNEWGQSSTAPGCPDDDGDGIPDSEDVCPWVATHDSYGDPCTPDEDWDGVLDINDECPAIWGGKNNGCP